jgi:peptide chain release factor 1
MLEPGIEANLRSIVVRFQELERLLADPDVIARRAEFQKLSREHKDRAPLIEKFARYERARRELEENEELLKDPEMRDLAREEIERLRAEMTPLEESIKVLLLPRDPLDEKNIILEVRGGAGGDEAALFAADLFRMYSRYAERHRWKVEIMSTSSAAAGGLKEAIALISGQEVYSRLKYESGVHRVQRVPATETQGRIHTSVATVAVLPEAEEIDIKLEDKDLRIDVMRAGGPGGQSVNTTDSAVRITHIPSGTVVVCMDEKSQLKNKSKAMKVLRSRIYEAELEKQQSAERDARRSMVKSGDRSDKIRTYNFPQDRLTDHRIGFTRHNIEAVMDGDLDEVIEALRTQFQAEALREAAAAPINAPSPSAR